MLLRAIKEFVYPRTPACPYCNRQGEEALCAPCIGELLEKRPGARCERCGRGMEADGLCEACAQDRYQCDAGISAFSYAQARDVIVAFKYHDMPGLAQGLGGALAQEVAGAGFGPLEAIVPVPIHPWRLLQRGYNQAELVARVLAEMLDIPVLPRALKRGVHRASMSASQTDAAQRALWVAGMYAPGRGLEGAKAVLLVDDVLTSGATLSACANALRQCGAQRVYAATVAAVDEGNPWT